MSTFHHPYDVFQALIHEASDQTGYFRCITYLRDHPDLVSSHAYTRPIICSLLAKLSKSIFQADQTAEEIAAYSQMIHMISSQLPVPQGIDLTFPTSPERQPQAPPVTPAPMAPPSLPAAPRKRPLENDDHIPYTVRRLKF